MTDIAIKISCPFCGQAKEVEFTPDGFTIGVAAYLTHMVESHWDELEIARSMRLAGGPVNDAWTRI